MDYWCVWPHTMPWQCPVSDAFSLPTDEKASLKRFSLVWAYRDYMGHTSLEFLEPAEPPKPLVIASLRSGSRCSRLSGSPRKKSGEASGCPYRLRKFSAESQLWTSVAKTSGHGNVRFRGSSGSHFRIVGGPFIAKPGHSSSAQRHRFFHLRPLVS